jgi:hypothetical protein
LIGPPSKLSDPTGARLSLTGPRAGEVDQFIPWMRYPLDSPFNLVLASKRENQRLRDELMTGVR